MKPSLKLSGIFAWFGLLTLLILAGSCTGVYFENPVPRDAGSLESFPEDWAGVYWEEPNDQEERPVYLECLRLERLNGTELLVSQETRIAEKDMPRLRAELEQRKNDGRLISYLLTDRFLIATVPVDDKDRPDVTTEQQVAQLYKERDWYIVGGSSAPVTKFDLKSGLMTKYETRELQQAGNAFFIPADSLSSEPTRLVARRKDGGFYLNVLREDGKLWELYYVTQSAPGELLVKTSVVKNEKDFQRRLDFYNGITPFVKMEGEKDYKISPDDRALEKLLTDEDLFQVTRLKKISEN